MPLLDKSKLPSNQKFIVEYEEGVWIGQGTPVDICVFARDLKTLGARLQAVVAFEEGIATRRGIEMPQVSDA